MHNTNIMWTPWKSQRNEPKGKFILVFSVQLLSLNNLHLQAQADVDNNTRDLLEAETEITAVCKFANRCNQRTPNFVKQGDVTW